MRITLEIEITGIEGWSVDWSDKEGVGMELDNLEREAEFHLAERLGLLRGNIHAEATLDRSGN